MRAKYTIDDVREAFKEAGYELLETEYRGIKADMRFRCPKHPDKDTKTTFQRIKKGVRCLYCRGKAKYTIEEVRDFFKSKGYELLEPDYINSLTPMRYRCNKHPDRDLKIAFSELKSRGKGCVYCAGLNKPEFAEVKSNFDKLGLELIETEYINQMTKMRYRCRRHPDIEQSAIYKTIKKGHGCSLCGREKAAKKIQGSGNWNWNGGISEIKHYLRKAIDEWKFNSLKVYDFKCAITGEKAQDLQVHHLTPFHVIRDEVMAELGVTVRETIGEYSRAELDALEDGIKKRHDGELGVPLRYHIHRLFHRVYGNNATKEDFLEFKERYHRGEFSDEEAIE